MSDSVSEGSRGDPPLLDDLPCWKCSYNLKTLSAASRCPECGLPVTVSIEGTQRRQRLVRVLIRPIARSALGISFLLLGSVAVLCGLPYLLGIERTSLIYPTDDLSDTLGHAIAYAVSLVYASPVGILFCAGVAAAGHRVRDSQTRLMGFAAMALALLYQIAALVLASLYQ